MPGFKYVYLAILLLIADLELSGQVLCVEGVENTPYIMHVRFAENSITVKDETLLDTVHVHAVILEDGEYTCVGYAQYINNGPMTMSVFGTDMFDTYPGYTHGEELLFVFSLNQRCYYTTITDVQSDKPLVFEATGFIQISSISAEKEMSYYQSVNTYCSEPNGEIEISPNGLIGTIHYEWSHDIQLNEAVAKDLPFGYYEVEIIDELNCSEVLMIEIENMDTIPIIDVEDDYQICKGDSIAISAGEGQYSWYEPNGNAIEGLSVFPDSTSVYQLELITGSSCMNSTSVFVELFENEGFENDTVVGQYGLYLEISQPFESVIEVAWSNGEDADNILVSEEGTYSVQIIDENGCEFQDSIFALIDVQEFDPVLYNVITPGSSPGKNDVLVFDIEPDIIPMELYIYDKWGKTVYRSTNYINDFNGDELVSGIYHYVLIVNGKSYASDLHVIK